MPAFHQARPPHKVQLPPAECSRERGRRYPPAKMTFRLLDINVPPDAWESWFEPPTNSRSRFEVLLVNKSVCRRDLVRVLDGR